MGGTVKLSDKVEVLNFPGANHLATAAAERWLASLRNVEAGSTCTAALSGGKIATPFFQAVVSAARRQAVSLQDVHFFWADERCVPPDDAESNFRIARHHLFSPLHIPEDRAHRIRGELAPEEACRQAEAELRHLTNCSPPQPPVLDFIFLGMGEDGHTASLFPGDTSAEANDQKVYLSVVGPKPPHQRVTMSYSTLIAAREVWVLISGAGKENAFRETLSGGTTPLGRVLTNRKRSVVFNDITKWI